MTMLRPSTPNPHADQVLCAHCRRWRYRLEVQAVDRVATGVRRYVCRRELSPRCWRDGLGDASVDRLVAGGPQS